MKVYEAKNLKKVIEAARKEFDDEKIFIEVQRCFQGSITHGSAISLSDIKKETDFFTKCVVKPYQELLKKVIAHEWSLDVSEIQIENEKYYITMKIFGK